MAMIKCPECGKEISENAKSCPNCGNPMNSTSKLENSKPKKKKLPILVKIPYFIVGALLLIGGISAMTNGTKKTLNNNDSNNGTQGVAFTQDGISTIDNSKFEILEDTSNISEDGTYTIKGKVKQKEDENFQGLFITFTMYDANNSKVRSTTSNTSNYLGDGVWEFEAYGNDADKIVISYELESIYGY